MSGPFVGEHVDVNVYLPQMVTELFLNKLFVPHGECYLSYFFLFAVQLPNDLTGHCTLSFVY